MNGRDVIHSSLSKREAPQFDDGGVFSDFTLRMGEVQKLIYPDDKASRSKKFVEYNVYVQQLAHGTGMGVLYSNCLLMNAFAGLADECHYTLRVPPTPSTAELKKADGLGYGSKVLLLCANGEKTRAYILGGVRDPRDQDDKDLGHHYHAVFNGMSLLVDKDGQLLVTYGGKTEVDGKKSDDAKDDQVGSTFKMLKDGAVQMADKDAKNAVTVDHANKKVTIAREDAFELGDATDKMLLGQSFRDAQQQMNNKLKGYIDAVKDILQNAGIAVTTASVKNAVPIVGGSLAASDFAQVGTLLIAASALIGQMGQAIGDFEQSATAKNSFLSKKNSAD